MKNKSILMLLLFLLVLIPSFNAFNFDFWSNSEENAGPPNGLDWYIVEPWELEVCSKWGGTDTINNAVIGSSATYISQLTITLAGYVTKYPNGDHLYEVAYYIQPLTNSVDYKIKLYNTSSDESYYVTDGVQTSDSTVGASGYSITSPMNKEYNQVKIGYREDTDGDGTVDGEVKELIVWVVDKESGEISTYDPNAPTGEGGGGPSLDDW